MENTNNLQTVRETLALYAHAEACVGNQREAERLQRLVDMLDEVLP